MGTEPTAVGDIDPMTLQSAVEVFSKKWSVAVVQLLLTEGPLGFSELQDDLNDVSGKVLSDCLDSLQEPGVIERRVLQEEPLRVEYALTDRGRDLGPVIASLESWAEAYLAADPPTVLLVDDDERLIEMHENWLEDGYRVETETDGEEARERLGSEFDLLVVDQRIPELSGVKLAQYVDVSDFNCEVIMLSSVDFDEQIRQAPIDEFIKKPTTPKELERTIDSVLGRSGTEESTSTPEDA